MAIVQIVAPAKPMAGRAICVCGSVTQRVLARATSAKTQSAARSASSVCGSLQNNEF